MASQKNPHTLRGMTAIRYAKNHEEYDGKLCKYNDPIEGPRHNLTVREAKAVAREDPSLIYLRVPSRKNNPRQPPRRVGKALKKYVHSQLGLPTQYTPAKVRVDSKGEIDIKFLRAPSGPKRNPKGFKMSHNGATYDITIPGRQGARALWEGSIRGLDQARKLAKQAAREKGSAVYVERVTSLGKSTIIETVRP